MEDVMAARSNTGLMGVESGPFPVSPTAPAVPAVYQAIRMVSSDLAKTGIGKDGRNQQQNYAFRGIEQVLNTLAPSLVHHGLVVLPRMVSRDVVERTTAKGSLQFFVTVGAEFDFVAVADGSKHTVATYGEAQDTADKATNKAMSAAYKYAAFLAFCIPLRGVLDDADATTADESVADDGYNDFVATLEKVAAGGMDKLVGAIKAEATPDVWRARLRENHARTWASLKAIAERADKYAKNREAADAAVPA